MNNAGTGSWDHIVSEHQRQAAFIEGILKDGKEKGDIAPLDCRNLSYVLSGMIRGIIFSWLTSSQNSQLEEKVSIILNIFLNGVSSKKQREG